MSDATEPMSGLAAPISRPKRRLTPFDRLVRVPLGFLWLVILALVTLPVMIYMTLLYYLNQRARLLVLRPHRPADESESPGKGAA